MLKCQYQYTPPGSNSARSNYASLRSQRADKRTLNRAVAGGRKRLISDGAIKLIAINYSLQAHRNVALTVSLKTGTVRWKCNLCLISLLHTGDTRVRTRIMFNTDLTLNMSMFAEVGNTILV